MKNVSFTALTFGCFLSACTFSSTAGKGPQMSEDRPETQDEPAREDVVTRAELRLPKQ